MDNLRYVTKGKLTFFKNKFSPQWRFLVHSTLHCLSTKSGSWDQFGSPLAIALICLSDGRQFNWSSYIFKGMVSNIGNAKKFLMYPRFFQAILGIETRIKRQYKVLKFSSKLYANMRLNFEGHPMPLLTDMLSQDQEGKGAGVAAQDVSQHMHALDQPQDHLSTPPRQQTSDPTILVFEQDEPLKGSFHMSPLRSTQAPLAGQTSRGAEDLITLTALSFVVSTLVQKVNTLETELKDYKKLFKDVVGKLVKKVKAMEVKLRTSKRKMVVSDSDQEEGGKQDVDLDALLALVNAAVTVDSNISPGGASDNLAASTSVPVDVLTSANVPTCSTSVPANVPTSVAPAGVSNKGKTLMAAKRLHDEEQAQVDRQRAEMQKRRQQKVLASAMYYVEADWINIMAQVEVNASLSKTLLGPVLEEPSSKSQKSTKAPIPSVSEVPPSPVVSSPKFSGTRRKSFGRNRLTKPKSKLKELDLDADAQTFIKVIPTSLGDINALYRIDRSTAYFTTLRDILHRCCLILKKEVVYMFADVPYPLLVKLMEKMLTHKLEIDKDVVGNDMTTIEQLIRVFNSPMLHLLRVEMVINSPWIMPILGTNELASPEQTALDVVFSRDIPLICEDFSSILVKTQSSRYVVPTGRVVVPTGRYVVPAGNIIIASPGRI
nr:hypothetical protein [Tanacetum cinerariifolium]